jgi:beta-1,4-mannosyltransferase
MAVRARDQNATPELTVLYDTRDRHFGQNPYLTLLRDATRPDAEVVGFSWQRALFGRYDLVHVHWPEYLLRPGREWMRPAARVLVRLWLWRLRVHATPMVRTMHDLKPLVGLTAAEAALLRRIESQTTARIWLTDPSGLDKAPAMSGEDVIIPHGDYLPWVAERHGSAGPPTDETSDPDAFALLCFGILRPYKRFEQVITATAGLSGEMHAHLRVLGSAPEPDYLVTLFEAAGFAPANVEVIARRASDDELYVALSAADLVVVPYDDLYNSGVVLLALSARRPVALRDNPISRALQAEFGKGWVILWSGDLDAAKLQDVIEQAQAPRAALDMQQSRSWESVGRRHRAFYAAVVAETAGKPATAPAHQGLSST